jgi:hypothetical protein
VWDDWADTYLLARLKHRDSIDHLTRQPPRRLRAVHFLQLLRQCSDFLNGSGLTVPVRVLGIPRALAIYSETRVVQALNEEVPPLVAIHTPRLHRKRLVLVVAVPLLLVLLFENGLDRFRGCEGPHDEGLEEVELDRRQHVSHNESVLHQHTRSVGIIFSKVFPPCIRFTPFHLYGHCALFPKIASSSARPWCPRLHNTSTLA